jgi:hypothetical protein
VARTLVPRLRLLRTPSRTPIEPPGTGYSVVDDKYGFKWDRSKLTAAEKEYASAFRQWMETTFNPQSGYAKSTWAREAGTRAALFPGTAAARANVYMEMHNQIASASRGNWAIMAERGADGAYIFRSQVLLGGQRVFVIDPNGNCFAGSANDGLTGRGAGKTVLYDKLQPVTPPAAAATAKPPVAEPPVKPVAGAPKVEPVKPKAGGVPEGPQARTGAGRGGGALKALGVQLIIMAVFWWFHRNDEQEYREHLQKMMDEKLTPKVDDGLTEHKPTIDLLTRSSPSAPLYAVVTADFETERTESGIGGTPTPDALTDIRYRSIYFSPDVVQADEVIDEDRRTPLFSQVTTVTTTKRVSYSLLIYDPEYEEEKKRLAAAWEDLPKDSPFRRMKPITGKAAENLEKRKWARSYREIEQYHLNQQLRYWREAKERSKPRPRVTVLKP